MPFLKVQQMTSPTGLEIADTGNATLFRVRMNTELTGSMVQLGAPGVSHVYMEGYIEPAHTGFLPRDQGNHTSQGDAAAAAAVWDGFRVIDRTAIYAWGERDCPFLFNAGGPSSNGEKPAPLGVAQPSGVHLTRLCLEPVEAPRNATLPDTSPDPLTSPPRQLPFGTAYEADVPVQQANMPWSRRRSWSGQPWQPSLTGVVVTTGNLHDLASVPGLMHRHSLAYNGAAPPAFTLRARVSCLAAAGAAAGSFCAVRDNATWSLGPTAALNLTEALAAGNVTAPAWWLPLVTDVGNAFRWCSAPQDDAPPPPCASYPLLAPLPSRAGCAIFNFTNPLFDFFRVYYGLAGWRARLDQMLADVGRNRTAAGNATDWPAGVQAAAQRLRALLSAPAVQAVYQSLRRAGVRLGQPVACGLRHGAPTTALRLCASARLVVEALGEGGAGPEAVIGQALCALDAASAAARAQA